VLVPNGFLLRIPSDGFGCFTEGGDAAFLVSAPRGRGRVVQLGGAGAFINSRLGKVDNGLLAVTLLAPGAGSRVAVLEPAAAGGGSRSLTDLIAPRVKLALLQLLIAFGLVVLWRARRLGRPVEEVQPVRIAGSELVAAVGELLQRARGRSHAAALLRDDLRRTLSERVGLPRDTAPDRMAEAVAARTSLTAERVRLAITGPDPRSEEDLVALAQTVETIRQEVASVR
jgi:hypothetical protein